MASIAVVGAGRGQVLAAASGPAPGTIFHVAGGDAPGPQLATSVALGPAGVAASGGALYVADSAWNVVRKVSASGYETVVAGNGTDGNSGEAGPATAASLSGPGAIAVDVSNNVVVADTNNNVVRVVAATSGTFYGVAMTAGRIYRVAGTGAAGFAGDGGGARFAQLQFPNGVALDGSGNLVVADALNSRVRVVAIHAGTFYGVAMTAGDIYTVAGNGSFAFSGDAGPATAAALNFPSGVAVDSKHNLVIADTNNSRVRVVAAATGTSYGIAMTAGDIYTFAGNGSSGFSGDGVPATTAALDAASIALDGSGNLVVATNFSQRVRVVASSTGTFFGIAMTAGDIYTVAGFGASGFAGDGGAATSARFQAPRGVAVDGSGNVAIVDFGNYRIRTVAATSATFYGVAMIAHDIYTVAGNGSQTRGGDGGPARNAQMLQPTGVAVAASGSEAIADSQNNVVRMIASATGTSYGLAMTAGDIYTVAGTGTAGYTGDAGPAIAARLSSPSGVAVDAVNGNLVIADTQNQVLRVVAATSGTFYGIAMTAGDIYTVAGTGGFGATGDGGPATSATLARPENVAIGPSHDIVVNDSFDGLVRLVAATSGTVYGVAVSAGDIYTVAGGGGSLADGRPALSAQLLSPEGVAVDAAGDLAIAESGDNRARLLPAHTGTFFGAWMVAGDIYTVAGTGTAGAARNDGPARYVQLSGPAGVGFDAAGDLAIADTGNNRVELLSASTRVLYAVSLGSGECYAVAGNGIAGALGDGGPATAAELSSPKGVAVAPSGMLLIADTANNAVRGVVGGGPAPPPAPAISTVAGGVEPGLTARTRGMWPVDVAAGGGALYAADRLYSVVRKVDSAGNQSVIAGDGVNGFSGDAGPATAAELGQPAGLAVDPAGDVAIADSSNNRVRFVSKATCTSACPLGLSAALNGDIYTVGGTGVQADTGDGGPASSATLSSPQSVAFDAAGNLLISDFSRIRLIATKTGTFYGQSMVAGDIYTVAGNGSEGFAGDGGPATAAQIASSAVSRDASGNLVLADSGNNRVRVVAAGSGTFYGQSMVAGDIYTVAGNGTNGFAGDGGSALSAELSGAAGVGVDPSGNLVVADGGNNRVRVVAATTGAFYGRSMTAGDIYTVGGNGTQGFTGDAGPAVSAELDQPLRVAVDGSGNVIVADASPVGGGGNNRVRALASTTGTFYSVPMSPNDIYTVAGDGTSGFSGDAGPATVAGVSPNGGVAVDHSGNVVLTDGSRVRVVASTTGTFFSVPMTAGAIYTVAGTGTGGFSGEGGPGRSAEVSNPDRIAVDRSGNLVIADTGNMRIRVLAAATGTFYGQAMTVGHIYTVAGTGVAGYAGDNGPATAAKLFEPRGVAVDPVSGNVVIADTSNGRVRLVAETTGTFYGAAMTAGDIYSTGAGAFPVAVAVDASENLLVAVGVTVSVQANVTGTVYGVALTAGQTAVIAGSNSVLGNWGDGNLAAFALVGDPSFGSGPTGLAVDAAGNVVISDAGFNSVRVMAEATGTFYGIVMTRGCIYTIAGGASVSGEAGDGGPASRATLAGPAGVTTTSTGDVLIADTGGHRVRKIAAHSISGVVLATAPPGLPNSSVNGAPPVFSPTSINANWSAGSPSTCTGSLAKATVTNSEASAITVTYKGAVVGVVPPAKVLALCLFGTGSFSFTLGLSSNLAASLTIATT